MHFISLHHFLKKIKSKTKFLKKKNIETMIGLLLAHGFEGAAWPSRETSPRRPSQRHRAR
jgi:hypothetical protein